MTKSDGKVYHLLYIASSYDASIESGAELLENRPAVKEWAEGCLRKNIRVTVLQRFKKNEHFHIDGIEYFFICDGLPNHLKTYQCHCKFNDFIVNYLTKITTNGEKAVIHFNGLIYPMSVIHLSFKVNKMARIVVQFHAEQPRRRLLNILSYIADKKIDRYFFTTLFHAEQWIKAAGIDKNKVVELMECSSICRYEDKNTARKRLGFSAHPLILWTGNLDENKDPLTIIEGFKELLSDYPGARLLMLYRYSPMLNQVKEKIANTPVLQATVTLIGKIDFNQVSDYYNAADIFVQGSHREGSGIAVLDSLACGAIPVITNIPSFVQLTGNGKVGCLWECDSVEDFVMALRQVMTNNLQQQQADCRKLFQQRWSMDQLADQAARYYFD